MRYFLSFSFFWWVKSLGMGWGGGGKGGAGVVGGRCLFCCFVV